MSKITSLRAKKQVVSVPFPTKLLCTKDLLDLAQSRYDVLNALMMYKKRYKHIFPSLATLAQLTGWCTKTIERAVAQLTLLGLVNSRQIGMNTSKVYVLSPWLFTAKVRNVLMRFIPALMSLALSLLIPPSNTYSEVVSTYIKKTDLFKDSFSFLAIKKEEVEERETPQWEPLVQETLSQEQMRQKIIEACMNERQDTSISHPESQHTPYLQGSLPPLPTRAYYGRK